MRVLGAGTMPILHESPTLSVLGPNTKPTILRAQQ